MGEFSDKAKGIIKEVAGDLTGNKGLQREGQRDQIKGQVERTVEDVKNAVKDTKKAIKESAKK